MRIMSNSVLLEAYIHRMHFFAAVVLFFSLISFRLWSEARIDLGKSVIDKEVVEKVGYINVYIFTLILKSMIIAKLERDFSLLLLI